MKLWAIVIRTQGSLSKGGLHGKQKVLHINQLLQGNQPFIWIEESQKGFDHIKNSLIKGDMYLTVPSKDHPLTTLETDGSDDGWGVVPLQIIDGKRKEPVERRT